MQIRIGLGDANGMKRSSFLLAGYILPVLDALVLANRIYLRSHRVPALYGSGVRYAEEPEYRDRKTNELIESFDDIPTCLKRGWGDCDDLAPWRVAELREIGIDAGCRVTWKRTRNIGRLFHVTVRWPDECVNLIGKIPDLKIENGQVVEDPSAILGMR